LGEKYSNKPSYTTAACQWHQRLVRLWHRATNVGSNLFVERARLEDSSPATVTPLGLSLTGQLQPSSEIAYSGPSIAPEDILDRRVLRYPSQDDRMNL